MNGASAISNASELLTEEPSTATDASNHIPAIPTLSLENAVMGRLRRRLWRANLWHKFRVARLRLGLIIVLSVCFWIGLYVLFSEGLQFLANFGDTLKSGVFNTYFSALMLMLMISSGLILYSGLYRSEETRFLFTQPIRGETLYVHKLHEAIWFGGWGFLLTSTPMLVASGVNAHAPWYYYAMMPFFLISFMYIPASIGAMSCVLVVSWLPRKQFKIVLGCLIILIVTMAWIGWAALDVDYHTKFLDGWFRALGERMQYTQQRLLPSYWLCAGLLEAEQSYSIEKIGYYPWSESLMFLGVLVSNALLCHLITVKIAGSRTRSSYQRLQAEFQTGTRNSARATSTLSPWRFGSSWLPISTPLRLLMLKELRIFCRDPVQWLQFVVFTGLLALYLVNLQRFPYLNEQATMIGFLNLAVVGLILSTFTTRFIYPMVSLEGKRFWILNLLPVDRSLVLVAKFLFAALGSWLPCAGLILLSDYMLSLPLWMIGLHQITILELCFGLAGMAVGLGALMPDMREEAPSKIAAGFGGTLNLVFSALYILLLVLLTAIPCQLSILQDRGLWALSSSIWLTWFANSEALWITQGISFLLALGASWGLMQMGQKAFRRQVF